MYIWKVSQSLFILELGSLFSQLGLVGTGVPLFPSLCFHYIPTFVCDYVPSADVLKDSEQCCSVQLLNSSEKLTEVIEHGLQLVSGPETPVKGRNSVSKLVQHLSVCLEVSYSVCS